MPGLMNLAMMVVTIFTFAAAAFAVSATNAVKRQTNPDEKLVGQMNTISTFTVLSALILCIKLIYETVFVKR